MYYEQYLYYRISAVAIGNGVIGDRTHQIQKGEVTLCLARIMVLIARVRRTVSVTDIVAPVSRITKPLAPNCLLVCVALIGRNE